MGDLKLSIPSKRSKTFRKIEMRPKRVRQWINTLPMANSSEAARRIQQTLQTQNRVQLKDENRLGLLSLFHAPIASLSDTLFQTFVTLPLPLSKKNREFVDAVIGLRRELAIGYKIAIMDALARSTAPSQIPFMAEAIARAINALAGELVASYQFYLPVPKGLWAELHQLYRFAETHEFAHQTLSLAEDDGESTIAQAYARALLLGFGNPYGLAQNDAQKAYRFLCEWPLKVKLIEAVDQVKSSAGQYLVSLQADGPGVPLPKDLELARDETLRVLDVIGLVGDTHLLIRRLQDGDSPQDLGLPGDFADRANQDLLRRLGQSWGRWIKRQSHRNLSRDSVRLCVGLKATHYFLSGETPFIPDTDNSTTGSDAPAVDVGEEFIDLDLIAGSAASKGDEAEIEISSYEVDSWIEKGTFQVYQWHARDESAGGLALERHGDFAEGLRVGDLIGLEHNHGAWRVAVVRWLKSASADQVEMGVQLLSPDARPVTARRLGGESATDQRRFQAILLPANRVLRQPHTLVLPPGSYTPDCRFELVGRSEEPEAVIGAKVVERTGAFELVEFVAAGGPAAASLAQGSDAA